MEQTRRVIMIRRKGVSTLFFLLFALSSTEAWIGPSGKNQPVSAFSSPGYQNQKKTSSSSLYLSGVPSEEPYNQQQNMTSRVLKKIRVAKAQAEIDRILAAPDPPLDLDKELERVVSISASSSSLDDAGQARIEETTTGEEDGEKTKSLDQRISELEVDLYDAVKNQRFDVAAQKQEEIGGLQLSDCGSVLQVNSAFYKAFSEKSIEDMEALWLEGSASICIHPSHKPLVGTKSVLKSWKKMFETKDGSFQRNWMEPHNIRLVMKGSRTAIVTCEEHVFARRFVRGKRRQTERINKLIATNIFRKVGSKWYMYYHHASWHADSEAAKLALGGSADKNNKDVANGEPRGKPSTRKLSVRNEDEDDDDMDIDAAMDGILGSNFGPLLGPDGPGEGKGKVKQVIVGNLPDLLGGGLGDLLGLGGSTGSGSDEGSIGPGGMMGPGGIQGGIIRINRIDENGDDDDDDDDITAEIVRRLEEEDDDDDDDDGISIIRRFAKSSSSSDKKKNSKKTIIQDSSSTKTTDSRGKESGAPKDVLRQNCISALRNLCDQGSISPKQKRILLTDIIACSAKGKYSLVEVAFELLCGEGEDKDAAEEEFADQCRVFALSLPESLPPPL